MSITAKELAKQLNLSEAAISMALNNKPGVSTHLAAKGFLRAETMAYGERQLGIDIKKKDT